MCASLVSSLCRICLENGANLPIFETKLQSKCSILSKMLMCFSEPINKENGYPEQICETCNNTLDSMCNFIEKFKESCRILGKSTAIILKQEPIEIMLENTDYIISEPDIFHESENKLNVKQEYSQDSGFSECLDNGQIDISLADIKKENKKVIKSIVKKKKVKKEKKLDCTNRIASSVLEGKFVCVDSKWMLLDSKSENVKVEEGVQNEKPLKDEKQTQEQCNKQPIRTNTADPFNKMDQKQDNTPAFLCDHCGETFSDKSNLTYHIKMVYSNIEYKCPHCPKICKAENYLRAHRARIHGEGEKKFTCPTCGLSFYFAKDLNDHCKYVHSKRKRRKPKPFPCELCSKIFGVKSQLIIHKRAAHTGERPAVCSICGKGFYHESYLKQHIYLHTGETPFQCPMCNRGYAQRGNMLSHVKHNHRKSHFDKPFLNTLKPCVLKVMQD